MRVRLELGKSLVKHSFLLNSKFAVIDPILFRNAIQLIELGANLLPLFRLKLG